MLGKILKGAAWCATFGLATVGALTFVPDSAWESFPEPLTFVRAKLANFGVAPTCYREDANFEKADVVQNSEIGQIGETSGAENRVASLSSDDVFAEARAVRTSVRIGENRLENRENSSRLNRVESTEFNVASELDSNEDFDIRNTENADFLAQNESRTNISDGEDSNGADAGNSGFPFEMFPESAALPVESVASDGTSVYADADKIPPFVAENELGAQVDGASITESAGNVGETRAFIPTASANSSETTDRNANSNDVALELEDALNRAERVQSSDETKDVFLTLNRIRREAGPLLSNENLSRLNAALDRLAFEVFYNAERSILEPLYLVESGDSLTSIAQKFNATPETLAAINGLHVDSNARLPVGTTLKTIRGPVSAEISVSKKELLLQFNGLYAGRFSFGIPERVVGLRGNFVVADKIVNPACSAIDASGKTLEIPGGAPENPLGAVWIALDSSLDSGVGLQGTNRPELIGKIVAENGGLIFSDREISQLNILLPRGAVVSFVD